MNTKPDFIVAGFNRTGSSTLHELLSLHPRIFMSDPKEIHYFDRNDTYQKGDAWYQAHFEAAGPDQLCGEASTSYIYKGVTYSNGISVYAWQPEEDAMIRMKKYNPSMKIIISLRQPVHNAKSHMERAKIRGIEDVNVSLEQAIDEELSGRRKIEDTSRCYLYLTQYMLHIRHLLEHFPREQVLFLKFEDWTKDQQGTLDQISRFLGIELHVLPADTALHSNAGLSFKDNVFIRAFAPLAKIKKVYAALKRVGLKQGYDKLDPESFQKLTALYRDDMTELEALTGLDLSSW